MPPDAMGLWEPMPEPDELDLMLLEVVVQHPEMNYKEIGKSLHVDQRTVAKRIRTMIREGVIKQTVEIDWSKLGLQAQAYVGSTTARGIDYAHKLYDIIGKDPRIVEGYETLGTYQYLVKIIDSDPFKMRDSVIRELDPLAADLTTSLVTKKLKQDYGALLRYLKETRFPSKDKSETASSSENR